MPPYAQHVVVRTGRDDWGGKIEEEEAGVLGTGVNLARSLKGLVGRGGRFYDVCMCVCVMELCLCFSGGVMGITEQRADASERGLA